jgi:hypothetical protein
MIIIYFYVDVRLSEHGDKYNPGNIVSQGWLTPRIKELHIFPQRPVMWMVHVNVSS